MNSNLLTKRAKNYLLYIEALIYLAWARFLVVYFPFKQIAPQLGEQMQETSFDNCLGEDVKLKRISKAIELMSTFTLWESKCLDQAIAALKMLERRGIDSTLYLGTAKDKQGRMIAHAWLRSGSLYITGSAVMKEFTTVGRFAKRLKGLER
ncbi:stage V sporulation protein S [Bacillus sp. AFS006103]|nr:stage V sporulation protein S [Bacillus sp. AFS006103]